MFKVWMFGLALLAISISSAFAQSRTGEAACGPGDTRPVCACQNRESDALQRRLLGCAGLAGDARATCEANARATHTDDTRTVE